MRFEQLLHGLDPSGDHVVEADGVVVHCPAHRDSHQSLKVSVTEDGKALLACRAGCGFDEVVAASAIEKPDLFDVSDADVVIPAGKPAPVEEGAPAVARLVGYLAEAADWLHRPEGAAALAYLERRFGVDEAMASALGLGYDPGGTALEFDLRGRSWTDTPRVVIPFRATGGYVHSAQARAIDEHWMRWAGLKPPPSGAWGRLAVFDTETGLDRVILTEGPGDALTVYAAGYHAIALPGAAVAADTEVQDAVADWLRGKSVYVAGDADQAGQRFTDVLVQALHERRVPTYRLELPDGVGDLADWRARNPAAFASELERAVGVARPAEVLNGTPAGTAGWAIPYPQNDIGNAQRLLDELAGDAVWTPQAGWFRWTGTHWQHDTLGTVRVIAQELIVRELAAAVQAGNDRLAGFFKRSGSKQRLDAMLHEAGVRCAVDISAFDADPDVLAFRNGVVDLRSGALLPHDRDRMISRRINLDFDKDSRCDRWETFLAELFPHDPELPAFLQRLIGYGVTGRVDEQAFVVLWGTGANGKSVFTDTLSRVFEPITNVTPFSTFEVKREGGAIPNDLAAMKGSRLVFASEGERGVRMAEAVLKRVTGQDKITARFMRAEFFTFDPTFLILMATNHRPSFAGQDEGLWRRVKLVPFPRYFAPGERDHYLGQRLLAEAEGIAAWAVAGAKTWYERGLGDPMSVREATKDYRTTSDALDGFMPDMLEPVKRGSARIPAPEAYQVYLEWCEREELPLKEQWGRRAFYQAMDERGYPRTRSNGTTYIVGLRRPIPQRPEPDEPPSLDSIFGERGR